MKNRFATLQLSEDIDMLVTKVCAFVYVCVCVCVQLLYSLVCQQAICCLLSIGRQGRTVSMRLSLLTFPRQLMSPRLLSCYDTHGDTWPSHSLLFTKAHRPYLKKYLHGYAVAQASHIHTHTEGLIEPRLD